jgi:hypothetical protein
MRTRRLLVALAAGLILALGAFGGAAAGQPAAITINIEFDTDPPTESFTTDGSVLCTAGPATSVNRHAGGNFEVAATLHLTKTLVCDDGTLTIKVNAGLNYGRGGTVGGWSIVGGTGAYAALRGGGHIVGRGGDGAPYDLVDSYYGKIHS